MVSRERKTEMVHSALGSNNKQPSIDWSILKKLPMDGTPHEVLIWKLSVIAVKHRLKPAFLYSEFKSPTGGQLVSRFAERIGLAVTLNEQERNLIDPSSPIDVARYVNGEGRGIWIHRREEALTFAMKLGDFVSGRGKTKNQGTMLGYPKCCVQWYEDNIEKPQGLKYMEFLREEERSDVEAAKRAMESPEFLAGTFAQFSLDAIENERMRAVLWKSLAAFPFIPHVACPSCVLSARDNSPSQVINARLAELATTASPSLYNSILKEANDESEGIEDSLPQ
jgi:hypothetical protein